MQVPRVSAQCCRAVPALGRSAQGVAFPPAKHEAASHASLLGVYAEAALETQRLAASACDRSQRRGCSMISVEICTRNRAEKLARCQRQYADMDHMRWLAWQLVVIGNASNEGTRAVVDEHATRLPITYALEPTPGLSNARNRGIAEAFHPLIAFT